jgi:hypothetical protein
VRAIPERRATVRVYEEKEDDKEEEEGEKQDGIWCGLGMEYQPAWQRSAASELS